MIIVLVIDSFDHLNNGTTMTAYRFAEMLKKRGHTVRVVSIGEEGPGRYPVEEWNLPVAKKIANRQGFAFAKPDPEVFRKAFDGADVAHFLVPLMMECKAAKVAKEMGIPCSGAFHLQPENITYILHLSGWKSLPRWIYRFFYNVFYDRFDHIHCPSKFIADQLTKNGYHAKMHVISNGVDDDFVPAPVPKQPDPNSLYHILMVGRLSPEKRQNILIEAVSQSKYADRIQLHLAGNGPCKSKLIKQGSKLAHPPIFGFYSKSDLISLIHSCDLYVHASVIEIEAISCMEAFSCGLVPVICNSDQSATPQFALDDRSLFEPDNPKDLAKKIDYWIEHPEEKRRMSQQYAKQGDTYRVEQSILEAEKMFEEVVRDHKKRTQ
ncbi:MAG: glycosyltransferase family 4 protein [Clostridiales bacterium]|nr:glycosyltransferase family 4 protein [Clostridiales bacterium]